MLRPALAALAVALAVPACAQAPADTPANAPAVAAPADADPALWVVRDADTTIHLFGTIHVLRPGLTWFDEAVRQAFDRSDTVVLEMVAPDPSQAQGVVAAKAFSMSGPALAEQLAPGDRKALADAIAATGLPAGMFDRMRPWFASITLSQAPLAKLGYDPANGPEGILTSAAAGANKPVIGLETFEQQLGFFDGIPQPAQVRLLDATLDELPRAGAIMDRMVVDWSRGDPDALARELNDTLKDAPEVAKALLYDRNARWAAWIIERLKTPGAVFVAVGAGHLAGERSVQAELAQRKVKVERVAY